MSRRLIAATLGALLLGLCAVAQAQSSTPTLVKESGNPINDQGSNYNYRSNITPNVPGSPSRVPRGPTGGPDRSAREAW